MSTTFEPICQAEHKKGNLGYDVPDYCQNCGYPFMDHYNGTCPDVATIEQE